MAQYINKDDVLSVIKKAIYIEEIYDPDTCEEWVYDAIDKKEVIEEINNLPTIDVEDLIDRYAVLAELDPQSVEYKIIKDLPSVVLRGEE